MYTTILWATDGSPDADGALEEALALLEPGGKLIAFHCDQRFFGGRAHGEPVRPNEVDLRRHIDAQVMDLRERGIDVEKQVLTTHGDAAHQIAEAGERLGVEVIVTGTRAAHGLTALLDGSVAARLLKHATVPVIVVPAGVHAARAATV